MINTGELAKLAYFDNIVVGGMLPCRREQQQRPEQRESQQTLVHHDARHARAVSSVSDDGVVEAFELGADSCCIVDGSPLFFFGAFPYQE